MWLVAVNCRIPDEEDPNHVLADNYFIASDGEQRHQVIGMTNRLVLLLVVFVDRSELCGSKRTGRRGHSYYFG
jgi:hypothetical protein